jgi:DNA polymerase elongation subunit (family B)|tara:strand:- start:8531 stop:10297 length:1767 start_codon:yes stop_codon:yes gene_type:complete
MYKKCYATRIKGNKYKIHLWDEGGYDEIEWWNAAYKEDPNGKLVGLKGETLTKTTSWEKNYNYGDPVNQSLHFHDIKPHQKFLIEKYGVNDKPSTGHRELFFDIECEIGGALTKEYIESAPMPITSIAWWDKIEDHWAILILDKKQELSHTKTGENKNKEIIPVKTEKELLGKFIEMFRDINPDILIGYNSDYFDIPYLYYRICNVLGEEFANYLSPIGKVITEKKSWFKTKDGKWISTWPRRDQFVDIVGVESLDYIRLHKKYSWKDEPSYKLDAIGKKYAGVNKIEYEGNLDRLFETDIHKFIEYNFMDVKILKLLDEKLQYIALTKNISHKGKHNYSEVYSNSVTQDGAISAYLLSQNIIPPYRPSGKKDLNSTYAGGYLFCPKAGLYKYMFDEDLTSLYPCIIMSINIGRETLAGHIIPADDRDNRLGLNDLKEKDSDEILLVENSKGKQTHVKVGRLIAMIEQNNLAVSANGCFFTQDKESVLATILNIWFDERVIYKNKMKKAYKEGDKVKGEHYYLMQYTMKILLNSLYGATALPTFRYGLPKYMISRAITLSGHRIIQESALCANKHMNKVLRNELKLEI